MRILPDNQAERRVLVLNLHRKDVDVSQGTVGHVHLQVFAYSNDYGY